MKKWTGKVMATTVAAAVLIGGFGGFGSNQAFADDESSDSSASEAVVQAPNTSIPLGQRVNLELNKLVSKAAVVLDMDYNDLNEQLKSGKSLAQIAENQADDVSNVINQLTGLLTQNVDIALNQQLITEGEAAALKSKIEETVKKAYDQAGYQDTAIDIAAQAPVIQLNLHDKTGALADLIGISKEQLDTAVELNDKSISDIAAAKGISDEQLIAKLKEAITPALQEFIHQK